MVDAGIMGTACLAAQHVDESAPVVDNTLQDDGEVVPAVDELLDSFGQEENGDMGALHGPYTVREGHVVEASKHLLWAQDANEARKFWMIRHGSLMASLAVILNTLNWLVSQ